MAMVSRVVGIVYNTNLVKGADVPQSIEDVLKPKFKGQIAVTPYVTGFYQFSAPDVLGIEFMRGFAKRLAPQIGGKIGCNSLDPVASGQFAMLIFDCGRDATVRYQRRAMLIFDCGRDATVRYQRRGAPMAHAVPKEIIRDNVIDLGVPINAKHKNVGKLLVNFLHTEEGQELLWKYGAYDLEVYPGSRSAKLIQKARKFLVSTVQRHLMLTKKGINVRTYQKEIRNIFRGATK
jgi:iron(III) transport system substrate-binding protein